MPQECQGERGRAGVSEGPMRNNWQRDEGGTGKLSPLIRREEGPADFCQPSRRAKSKMKISTGPGVGFSQRNIKVIDHTWI